MKKEINDEITHKIIGCAMQVHNIMGNGFQEVIYQRCLAIEMLDQGLSFEREKEIPLYYKGVEVGSRRVDFLVENKVLVELKAIIKLEDVHLARGLNYLQAYNLPIGLLINFGGRHLEFKRLIRKDVATKHPVHPVHPAHPDSDYLRKDVATKHPVHPVHPAHPDGKT